MWLFVILVILIILVAALRIDYNNRQGNCKCSDKTEYTHYGDC